jgi:hypothetical protein
MIERKTTLNWVLNPTAFEDINKDSLVSHTRPLGTGTNSVNAMIACAEEMELLLPDIIGVSPNSSTSNWSEAVANYWHNFGLDVPIEGYKFDASLMVDLHDHKRKGYIATLLKELNVSDEASTTEKIAAIENYLNKETTKEDQKYKYAKPVDAVSYLAWRYCLVSGKVANEPDLINKSTKIEFYLMDESAALRKRKAAAELKNKAVVKFSELISGKDMNRIDNLLIAMDSVTYLNDLKSLSKEEKQNRLLDIATTTPAKFLNTLKDKNVEVVAEIKKLTMASIINKLPNTSIYVDASDPSLVLGNSLDEVVTYFSNDKNQANVNQMRIKFNALK